MSVHLLLLNGGPNSEAMRARELDGAIVVVAGNTSAPDTTERTPFAMKRHDLRPYIPIQFFQPDGVTPLDTSVVLAMNLICRVAGAVSSAVPKFKKALTAIDTVVGSYEYRWTGTDTDTSGNFNFEIEMIWPNGDSQTFPADSYFELVVADDLG